MYIWNKVLLGLIALVSLAFFFFAARALKTHQAWQASVDKQTVALEQVAKDKESLGASIDDLKVTVHRYTFDRGRVWFNTKPQQLNPTTGEVAVAITLPPPPVNSPLFAFEDPTPQNPSGVYMGEFTVKSVDRQQMQLAPTWALTDQRKARLQQSQGMWSLYEIMPKPMPIPTLFDRSSPGAEPSAQAASGEAAAEPSPSDAKRVAPDKPAILSLADFRGVFTEYYRGRAELLDFRAALDKDLASLTASNAQAQQRVDQLTKEIAALKTELNGEQTTLAAVSSHRKAVEEKLKEIQAAAAETQKANEAAVREIARIQTEAARRIDERTRAMAQAEAR